MNDEGSGRVLPFRRIQIGPNEVDYVAEDVTIRHFKDYAVKPNTRIDEQAVKVGQDVTVRYFANRSTVVSQTGPTSPTTKATK